jgi:hypothetical protein
MTNHNVHLDPLATRLESNLASSSLSPIMAFAATVGIYRTSSSNRPTQCSIRNESEGEKMRSGNSHVQGIATTTIDVIELREYGRISSSSVTTAPTRVAARRKPTSSVAGQRGSKKIRRRNNEYMYSHSNNQSHHSTDSVSNNMGNQETLARTRLTRRMTNI